MTHNRSTIHQHRPQIYQKSHTNQSTKSILIESRKKLFQNPQQYGPPDVFLEFRLRGVDFGNDFGAPWFFKVLPKSTFVLKNQTKREKGGPRNVWKTNGVFAWFLIPKWERLKGKSERLAMECCKISMFRVSWSVEKIDAEMDTKSNQNRI